MLRFLPRIVLGVIPLFVLFLTSAAVGQSVTSGTLTGIATDSAGLPLSEIHVMVREVTSGFSQSVTTPRSGEYSFGFLHPGEYEIFAERLGYQPQHIVGVPIRPGQRLDVPLVLQAVTGPVARADQSRFGTTPQIRYRAGTSQWLSRVELTGLPDDRREFTQLGSLSSEVTDGLEAQGLPAYLSRTLINGLPLLGIRPPYFPSADLRTAALPLHAFSHAELLTNASDVEWNGPGGAFLNGYTRRGTRELRAEAFGHWADGAASSAGAPAPSGGDLHGGFWLSAPVIQDTASFVVGAEVWRRGFPLARGWDSLAARVATVALESHGVTLEEAGPDDLASEVVSAFGRFDWQIASTHFLTVHANLASVPSAYTSEVAAVSGSGIRFNGTDISAGAMLTSRLGRRLAQEVRIGIESGRREYDEEVQAAGSGLPRTRIAAEGFRFGADPGVWSSSEQMSVRASETIHFWIGSHRLKAGISAGITSYEQGDTEGRAGEFVFSGPEQFARGQGYFRQTLGPVAGSSFSLSEAGVFVQDTWTPTRGLDVLAGVRFDARRLPLDEISIDQEWIDRTGLAGTEINTEIGTLAPRVGFVWDVQGQGRWVIHGSGGLYTGAVDPSIVSELLTRYGQLEVRRGVGALGSWPAAPERAAAPVVGPILTLAAPGLSGPITRRAGAGISRLLGWQTTVHLSGSYRYTDLLPRRSDLNLRPAPITRDQHGRPIYGTLRQVGGLLTAEPGSNRRFADFDQVSAINADGWSEYRGITLALERDAGDRLSLLASYTYSNTQDNWMLDRSTTAVSGLLPFPDSTGNQKWATGRSDFDVPHRAVLGAEGRLPLGVRVAALYRYRSGYPFTPGFGEGVDANGDGSSENDPAFVDGRATGIDGLLAAWDCLRTQVGRFAARNSCRAPSVSSLDARLSVRLVRVGRYSAEAVVDGLNLIGSDAALPDQALFLIDQSGELATDPRVGAVIVPLVVNPNFGRPLANLTAGRILRLGFRLSY